MGHLGRFGVSYLESPEPLKYWDPFWGTSPWMGCLCCTQIASSGQLYPFVLPPRNMFLTFSPAILSFQSSDFDWGEMIVHDGFD